MTAAVMKYHENFGYSRKEETVNVRLKAEWEEKIRPHPG